jgi:hypothetical protein
VIKRSQRCNWKLGDQPLKKNSNVSNETKKSGQKSQRVKARGPVQRDSKKVMAELVAKLSERLGPRHGLAYPEGCLIRISFVAAGLFRSLGYGL